MKNNPGVVRKTGNRTCSQYIYQLSVKYNQVQEIRITKSILVPFTLTSMVYSGFPRAI